MTLTTFWLTGSSSLSRNWYGYIWKMCDFHSDFKWFVYDYEFSRYQDRKIIGRDWICKWIQAPLVITSHRCFVWAWMTFYFYINKVLGCNNYVQAMSHFTWKGVSFNFPKLTEKIFGLCWRQKNSFTLCQSNNMDAN